uniref:Uncharacterized protein n=1 Tax=Mycena chlorophos TaxID=658473 RepID=A0ABQ0L6K5_MYCCL|nr:predicted protein [Mycena chlorophos]
MSAPTRTTSPFGPIAPSPLSVSRYELPPPPNFPSFTLVLTRAAKPDNEVLTFPWTPIEYVPTRPKPKKVVVVELPAPATAPVDAKPNFVKRFLGYIKRFMAALKAKLTLSRCYPKIYRILSQNLRSRPFAAHI